MSAAGVVTNRDYLIRVLGHEAFQSGNVDTHFCADHAAGLAPPADRSEAAARNHIDRWHEAGACRAAPQKHAQALGLFTKQHQAGRGAWLDRNAG